MNIKVEYTKTHTTDIVDETYPSGVKKGIRSYNELLVTDAELVLVECKHDEVNSIENGYGYYHKPILINRTEKIEVGDWAYDAREGKIIKSMFNLKSYEDFEVMKNFHKILALPEHFSSQQLQDIVDGKLKEGQKLFLECEEI